MSTGVEDEEESVHVLPKDYEAAWEEDTERRIYLIGPGAIGTLVAHQLAGLPDPPPITLVVNRQYALDKWREVGEQLKVTRHGVMEARKNVTVQKPDSFAAKSRPVEDILMIRHLIVTVKAPFTRNALEQIKHRLDASSTIVYLQNGRGIVEEVNEHVFPDITTRPRYILGTVTHGVTRNSFYNVTQHGVGSITLSLQPDMSVEEWEEAPLEDESPHMQPHMHKWPASARYLMRTLTRAPMLKAAGADPWEGLKIALLKLAVNAIVNPLTALFDCKNGELLPGIAQQRLINLLLAEVSLVFRSLPEVQNVANKDVVFGPLNLLQAVKRVCHQTASNDSSMVQDVRAGRETEIDYLNGWVVKRGEELGIKCVINYALVQMVKAKSTISKNVVEGNLPLEFPRYQGVSSDEAYRANLKRLADSNLGQAPSEISK